MSPTCVPKSDPTRVPLPDPTGVPLPDPTGVPGFFSYRVDKTRSYRDYKISPTGVSPQILLGFQNQILQGLQSLVL